jgi:hypothetical protein
MKGVQLSRSLFLLAAAVAAAISGQDLAGGTLRIVRTLDLPEGTDQVYDLAWDGQHLWAHLDGSFGDPFVHWRRYQLDPADGSAVSFTPVYPFSTSGAAWDGSSLWMAELYPGGGPYPPGGDAADYIHRLAPDGSVLESFELPYSPDAHISGAAWDGSSLWLVDALRKEFLRMDPRDMSVLSSFSLARFGPPEGLTWAHDSLWTISRGNNVIFQLGASGNLLDTWTVPAVSLRDFNARGLTFDGEYLWLGTGRWFGPVLHSWPPVPPIIFPAKLYQLAVPEPSAFCLLGFAGVVGFYLASSRRRQRCAIRVKPE